MPGSDSFPDPYDTTPDLAGLARRSQGVLLRFVSYAEDKGPPILEERIMPAWAWRGVGW